MAASLQLTSESLNLDSANNLCFAFPEPLTEKYAPSKIAEFVGLENYVSVDF